MIKETIYDLIVIGGGPAGMMAAGRAAELGRSVLLLEKNDRLGVKLLMTGGGRCNLTNNKPDVRSMLSAYGDGAKFLFSPFSRFGVRETLDFFNERGVATKEESGGKMFPVSDKSQTILDCLVKYMKEGGVAVRFDSAVTNLEHDNETGEFIVRLKDKSVVGGKACVVAVGGSSYPATGSTGDGFKLLAKLGHTIVTPEPALVPIEVRDGWVRKLSGVTLRNVSLSIQGVKNSDRVGDILFTHFGVSGPMILNISKQVGTLLKKGKVVLALDLFPETDEVELKQRLQSLLEVESNRQIGTVLAKLVPSAVATAILDVAGISERVRNHDLKQEDRKLILSLLKALPFTVHSLLGLEKAMVSSGGVDLREVDFKTMESRIVPGLYLVGDVLNIDRPTGGYSLQLAWTTGIVAGSCPSAKAP